MKEDQLSRRQREFIRINHWLMTVEEMVGEINDRVERDPSDAKYLPGPKLTNYDVAYYCRRRGFIPIKETDRAVEYIRRNPGLTLPELAGDVDMSEATVRKLCGTHKLPYALGKRGPKTEVA